MSNIDLSTDSKRERIGWYFYDWANSSYPLVINTAIFPLYYNAMTSTTTGNSMVEFLGMSFHNSALYSYTLSLAYLLVSFITPLLSGVADYSGKKKRFLRIFCTLGSVSCAGLFFFTYTNLWWGLLCVLLSTIGFSGSLVFYNAFLPEIAKPEEQDTVSARGFSMGYIGSSLLLIASLAVIMMPSLVGIPTEGKTTGQLFVMIAPFTFLAVAFWWQGFAQITFNRLKDRNSTIQQSPPLSEQLSSGFKELKKVWLALQKQPILKLFLASFFTYSMGVQTVILMSTLFGEQELHLEQGQLITTILILQFIAVAGSIFFSKLSGLIGNTRALMTSILIWMGVCVFAYFITSSTQFYILAGLVGVVLGGIQSLSRSTYSKLLNSSDTASYFSFYDVCEKIGIVVGSFSYGWISDFTGSTRTSIVSLIVFFAVGLLLMWFTDRTIRQSSI
jgi:MFS transporter, UMF1 family